jgi:FkbM family methyltransferase
MNKLTLNTKELQKWFKDMGDYTHNINYNLDENSNVIDLGGYTGVWAQQIIDKYNPNIYILEPIFQFHSGMVSKFSNNSKVRLMNVGIGARNEYGTLFLSSDGTSSNLTNGESVNVEFNTFDTILKNWGLSEVDLLQMNIEGDEYPVLEHMLETGSINKIKNIQIQFHLGVDNDIQRREKIREGLISNGFRINFDYPFVWESWGKNF